MGFKLDWKISDDDPYNKIAVRGSFILITFFNAQFQITPQNYLVPHLVEINRAIYINY